MGRKNMVFGCVPSKMDGSELKFTASKSLEIPEEYSYVNYLPKAFDQGQLPICVTESVAAYINWNINVDNDIDNKKDHDVDLLSIYLSRSNSSDGMTFKDALHFLKHKGVQTDIGISKIEKYALVSGINNMKSALILNGPLMGAFLVRDAKCGKEFWKGHDNLGGHAISIVGYNKKGFIIRNSWGEDWGNKGYTILPYDDFHYLLECWTIIG